MNLKTTEMLTNIDFANDEFLKKLYNYNLATNRNNYEDMQAVREEYFHARDHDPEMAKLWYEINKTNTIAS